MRKSILRVVLACLSAGLVTAASAQVGEGGSKADAERAVQAYLVVWSSDGHFDRGAVARFYAPRVVYYGKRFSRADVLSDKLAYARAWPVRHYAEVPGSLIARCNADRSMCQVDVTMRWRRVSAGGRVSTGRARLGFDFVPAEGGRKIARESARIISVGC